eukprot:PhF_6_TR9771/c0_g1_i1/m.15060
MVIYKYVIVLSVIVLSVFGADPPTPAPTTTTAAPTTTTTAPTTTTPPATTATTTASPSATPAGATTTASPSGTTASSTPTPTPTNASVSPTPAPPPPATTTVAPAPPNTTAPPTPAQQTPGPTPPPPTSPASGLGSTSMTVVVVGVIFIVILVFAGFYFVVIWPRTATKDYRLKYEKLVEEDRTRDTPSGGGKDEPKSSSPDTGGGQGGNGQKKKKISPDEYMQMCLYNGASRKDNKIPTMRDIEAAKKAREHQNMQKVLHENLSSELMSDAMVHRASVKLDSSPFGAHDGSVGNPLVGYRAPSPGISSDLSTAVSGALSIHRNNVVLQGERAMHLSSIL